MSQTSIEIKKKKTTTTATKRLRTTTDCMHNMTANEMRTRVKRGIMQDSIKARKF